MHDRTDDREAGFTLIELLIAIMVSGLILTALSTAFIVAMKGTAGANDRFVESHGAQTLATYFASDVQSANPGMVDTAPATGTGCNSTPAGTNVVRMQWTEMTTATRMTAFSAAYRMQKVGTEWQLARHFCSDSQNLPATPSAILVGAGLTSHVVAHVLSDPTPPSAYVPSVAVSGRKITLNLFAALGAGEAAPYSYSLSASMRTPTLFPRVASISLVEASPTNGGIVHWTVTFSEAVNGVDPTDFSLVQAGAVAGAAITTVTGSGTIWTVTASSGSGSGTLGLNLVDDNSVMSAATGNALGGPSAGDGNFPGLVYAIDKTPPTVNVEQKAGQLDPTTTLPVLYTVTFSESVSGFDATDVTKSGTTSGGTVGVTGSGAVYEIAISGVTGDGTVIASINANQATDLAGNLNSASTSTDNTVTFDSPPSVSAIVRADANPTRSPSVRWTVTFNKNVTGVDTADFTPAQAGGVSGAAITAVTGLSPGTTFTVTATTGAGLGTLGLNLVDDNSIKDAALNSLGGPALGDGNRPSQPAWEYQIVGTIGSVQLKNGTGGTPGKIEKGDQIIVTFSTGMNADSFCPGWSSNLSDATVTVRDGTATNDTITVATPSCTFRFGSIDLGSNAFVSGGDVTFSGSGVGNSSSITWNAGTLQLTIALGNKNNGVGSGGTLGTLTGAPLPAPVYSAEVVPTTTTTYIKDSTLASINNSPFALPSGVEF